MVSRKDIKDTAGWLYAPQTKLGEWAGQQIGSQIQTNNQRVKNKRQASTFNNYKTSNLNLPTYNARYPGFDEEDYKKLEQGAIDRGLTGEEKTQFMDEAYQYYYPQVLNQHGLEEREKEINQAVAENGGEVLNGNQQVGWNMKLVDLAQTAKRVKGIAYDCPDDEVINAIKTNIPDGEQLLLDYLNNGDDTILYKAGLKQTDAQKKLDEYNNVKENINKALTQNWKQLSQDGLKYLRDYNTLFQVVDEARSQGMGQGMTDNDLLLNLLYISPDLQQIEKEIGKLNLDDGDKRILGITDDNSKTHDTVNVIRDWLGWNSDTPATIEDINQAIYVKENGGLAETVKNFRANLRNWGDSIEKFGYRAGKDIENFIYDNLPTKNILELELGRQLSDEEYNKIVEERKNQNIQDVQAYNESLDKEIQASRKRIGLDPIIEDYYSKQGIIESLVNGDGGAGYKLAGDTAGNWDMILGILGSAINPAIGLTIMGTDTFARENQESFDSLINAQTKQGVPYEEAYDNASKGAVVVGAINTAIELGLEKFLGGVETTAGENIKKIATKNLNKEVNEMLVKRGILKMLADGLTTQARSSLEEGLEEIFQQLTHNIAISKYDKDHKISEGLWEAFEGGALNPMNLLAGGSELLNSSILSEADKQKLLEWSNNNEIANGEVVGAYNPKAIVENIKNGTSNTTSNTQGIFDRITDWGAEKITDTVSPQDKLYKAQEPLMQTLTKSKDLEKKRGNSDRANQLILENGFIPTDTSSRLEAHDTTMKNVWQQIEDKINGGKEIMIDLSEISDVLDEFIAKQKRTKSTLFDTDLERLSKESAALRGQQISLPDVERLKQGYNAKINNWGDEKISDVMANGLREATHKIGVIEDNLLSEIPGEFQALKNDFGALKDTYEDVFKADMRNQRRKGGTLAETYSRIEGISDIVNGVLGTLTGKGDLQSIAKGGAKILVGKSLAKAKNVDFLIEQGFKGLAEELGIGGAITDNNITPTTPANPMDTINDKNVGMNPADIYLNDIANLEENFKKVEGLFWDALNDYKKTKNSNSLEEAQKQFRILKEINNKIDEFNSGGDQHTSIAKERFKKWNDRATSETIAENALAKEMAGNQAQELYNQGDENLSPTQTDMTEQTNESLIKDVRNMKAGEQINLTSDHGEGGIITKTQNGDYRMQPYYRFSEKLSPEKRLYVEEDMVEYLQDYGDRIHYEYIDNVPTNKSSNVNNSEKIDLNYEGTEEDIEELRQTNPDEYNRLMDEEEGIENYEYDDYLRAKAEDEKGETKQYADEAYRPSITMKTDGYETVITEDPTQIKSIDSEGNWLANDEGGIKIKYHPDGYLDVKLTEYPSSDEMIGFEQFKYEPIKEVELTILDEQTGKPVRSNRVNSIDELLEYLEDYFINGNTDI